MAVLVILAMAIKLISCAYGIVHNLDIQDHTFLIFAKTYCWLAAQPSFM